MSQNHSNDTTGVVEGLSQQAMQRLQDMLGECPKCKTQQPLITGLYQKPSFGGKDIEENQVKICASCNFDHYMYCKHLEHAGKLPEKKATLDVWHTLFTEGFLQAPAPELKGEAKLIAVLRPLVTARIQNMLDKQRDEARYRKMSRTLEEVYQMADTKLFKKAADLFPQGKEKTWLNFFMMESKDSSVRKDLIEKEIEHILSYLPVWTEFLQKVPGIGVWLGGYIISAIGDPKRFSMTAKLSGYAGLRVDATTNKAQGKKPFSDKGKGNQLDYSPMMKMILVEILPEVLVKMKGKFPDSPYSQLIEAIAAKEVNKAINANPTHCYIPGCNETEIVNLGYKQKENSEEEVFMGYCCEKTHGKATEHKFFNPAHRFRRVKRKLGKKILADTYHVWLYLKGEHPVLESNTRIMHFLNMKSE